MQKLLYRVVLLTFLTISWISPTLANTTPTPAGSVYDTHNLDEDAQLSGVGGIGNTRSDVINYWNLTPSAKIQGDFVEDGYHYVAYNTPDLQLAFVFMLQDDDAKRDTDRVIDMVVSFMKFQPAGSAKRLYMDLLPEDAKQVGRARQASDGAAIYKFESKSAAAAFPRLSMPGFGNPGEIWIAVWPNTGNVGVIQISLYDPYER